MKYIILILSILIITINLIGQIKNHNVIKDTVVQRIELIKILESQKQKLLEQKKQIEEAINQIDGQIAAFSAISTDSIKVRKY